MDGMRELIVLLNLKQVSKGDLRSYSGSKTLPTIHHIREVRKSSETEEIASYGSHSRDLGIRPDSLPRF